MTGLVGAVVVGVVAGALLRALGPVGALRQLSPVASWLVPVVLGVAGAVAGWLLLTVWAGLGDVSGFQAPELVGPLVGAAVVLPFTSLVVRMFEREGD